VIAELIRFSVEMHLLHTKIKTEKDTDYKCTNQLNS